MYGCARKYFQEVGTYVSQHCCLALPVSEEDGPRSFHPRIERPCSSCVQQSCFAYAGLKQRSWAQLPHAGHEFVDDCAAYVNLKISFVPGNYLPFVRGRR